MNATKTYKRETLPPHLRDVKTLRRDLHRAIIRAMREHGWQTHYAPAVKWVKLQYLRKRFGYDSSVELTRLELIDALNDWEKNVALSTPPYDFFKAASQDQINLILRLAKYKLANVYGDGYMKRQLPSFLTFYYTTHFTTGADLDGVTLTEHITDNPYNLTIPEAQYVITRLLEVERKVTKEGAFKHTPYEYRR